MSKSKFICGLPKLLFYMGMGLACACRFRSIKLLIKAAKFNRIFMKHKLLKLKDGSCKLDFYMPRYPSKAFWIAMEDKLLHQAPRPVSVVLSITKACSYKCPHCYQRRDAEAEMPIELLVKNVREMRDFGIVAWAIEGGEPLLKFPRLEAVLQEVSGLEVWVNSTGCGATTAQIARMAELNVTGVMSSIHSVVPAKHDKFTGVENSWQTAIDFLQSCKRSGMLAGFNTVLSDEDIIAGEIDNIMELAMEQQLDYVQLIHPKPSGAWLEQEFNLSKSQQAIAIACEAHKKYNSKVTQHMPILTAQVFEESEDMLGCCCGGIDRFYVGASGEVQPCEFVNLSFGNLQEISFDTAYQRMRKAFATPCTEWCCSKFAKDIVEYNPQKLPISWPKSAEIVAKHPSGTPTKVYKDMGIYR